MATSLKLPADLKARVERIVRNSGKSAHAFMIEAVAEQTRLAELRKQFVDEARESLTEFQRTGIGYGGDEMHAWMKAKAAGKKARRPRAKSWRK